MIIPRRTILFSQRGVRGSIKIENADLEKQETGAAHEVIRRYRELSAIPLIAFDFEYWRPVCLNFTAEVLKAGVEAGHFTDMPVVEEHWAIASNVKGTVTEASFNSTTIPQGVDGRVILDKDLDEKLALSVERGYLKKSSIAINHHADWSHPDMDLDDFLRFQGAEKDGKLVCFIPREIISTPEFSIVLEGADPTSGQFSKKPFNFDSKNKIFIPDIGDKEVKMQDNTSCLESIRGAITTALGKTVITDDQLQKEIQNLIQRDKDQAAQLKKYEIEVNRLSPFEEFQTNLVNILREDIKAKELLLHKKDNPQAEVLPEYKLTAINNADYEALIQQKNDLMSKLANETAGTCPNCLKPITVIKSSLTKDPTPNNAMNEDFCPPMG